MLSIRLALATSLVLRAVVCAAADPPPVPEATGANRPFEIADNSFLVEEAFNQEAGIYQNIMTATRAGGRWDGSFTQEWPVASQAHQFSYTIPFAFADGRRGVGDVLLNYRYQLLAEHGRVPAFSPRLSLILPSGREAAGFGSGVVGWQANLPVSKQFGNLYLHGNAGVTYLAGVRGAGASAGRHTLTSPMVAASAIVRVRPMLNLMCETVAARVASAGPDGVERVRTLTVSPGFRGGWNVGSQQVIVGAAFPVTLEADQARSVGLLTYVSYELPWKNHGAR